MRVILGAMGVVLRARNRGMVARVEGTEALPCWELLLCFCSTDAGGPALGLADPRTLFVQRGYESWRNCMPCDNGHQGHCQYRGRVRMGMARWLAMYAMRCDLLCMMQAVRSEHFPSRERAGASKHDLAQYFYPAYDGLVCEYVPLLVAIIAGRGTQVLLYRCMARAGR